MNLLQRIFIFFLTNRGKKFKTFNFIRICLNKIHWKDHLTGMTTPSP
jgi:hypothetical protein